MPILVFLFSLFSLMFRSDDPAPSPDQDRPLTKADLKREIKTLMAGDPDAAADKLASIMADNRKYRDSQHRLTDDQWAELKTWQGMGNPGEIKVKLDQLPALIDRIAKIDRADELKQIAIAAKVSNTDALAGLMGDQQFEIVPIANADGTTDQQVLVIQGTTKTPLKDFVTARMAWAVPVLFPDPSATQGASGAHQPATQGVARPSFIQGNGTPPPAQGANGGLDPAAKAKEFNDARNANAVNPFAPR